MMLVADLPPVLRRWSRRSPFADGGRHLLAALTEARDEPSGQDHGSQAPAATPLATANRPDTGLTPPALRASAARRARRTTERRVEQAARRPQRPCLRARRGACSERTSRRVARSPSRTRAALGYGARQRRRGRRGRERRARTRELRNLAPRRRDPRPGHGRGPSRLAAPPGRRAMKQHADRGRRCWDRDRRAVCAPSRGGRARAPGPGSQDRRTRVPVRGRRSRAPASYTSSQRRLRSTSSPTKLHARRPRGPHWTSLDIHDEGPTSMRRQGWLPLPLKPRPFSSWAGMDRAPYGEGSANARERGAARARWPRLRRRAPYAPGWGRTVWRDQREGGAEPTGVVARGAPAGTVGGSVRNAPGREGGLQNGGWLCGRGLSSGRRGRPTWSGRDRGVWGNGREDGGSELGELGRPVDCLLGTTAPTTIAPYEGLDRREPPAFATPRVIAWMQGSRAP